MFKKFLSTHLEDRIGAAINELAGDKAAMVLSSIAKVAAKQGGSSMAENYQLLGKRAAIGIGVALLAVNTIGWIGGTIISRRREEKRIEETVRRVLAEERAKEEAATAPQTA